MHKSLSFLFICTLLFAGGYWYHRVDLVCHTPLAYDIGTVDNRFHISREDVQKSLTQAEDLWENAEGRNLFAATPGASFKINLIFDDRQQTTAEEATEKAKLDTKEAASIDLKVQYESAVVSYNDAKKKYERDIALYEKHLAEYNAEVAAINGRGGATPEDLATLKKKESALTNERNSVNAQAVEVKNGAEGVNRLGEEGNKAVRDYNQSVLVYNKAFAHGREFTQGEYKGDRINIYQYRDIAELRRVLAHEFGHALSLDHVEDPRAVMYYLMQGKAPDFLLTEADKTEFTRVCGVRSLGDQVNGTLKSIVTSITSKL